MFYEQSKSTVVTELELQFLESFTGFEIIFYVQFRLAWRVCD